MNLSAPRGIHHHHDTVAWSASISVDVSFRSGNACVLSSQVTLRKEGVIFTELFFFAKERHTAYGPLSFFLKKKLSSDL